MYQEGPLIALQERLFSTKKGAAQDRIWFKGFPLLRKTDFWNGIPLEMSLSPKDELSWPVTSSFTYPPVMDISYTPSYEEWEKTINLFKERSEIRKVILSRIKTITFTKPLDPFALYKHIQKKRGFPFGIFFNPTTAFLGVSPEMLYRKKGLTLETEALAGTRPLLEKEDLLASIKDRSEFQIVKDELFSKLQLIAHPFPYDSRVFIKEADTLCHLHFPFSVELLRDFSEEDLISFLHPTSAIGGYPRDLSLAFIDGHELHDRGLYAGVIGTTTGDHSEAYVMIRSALIQENKMHIFTGAGILENSDPKNEWVEVENKTKLFQGYS